MADQTNAEVSDERLREIAKRLRQWADVLEIPSGDFVNDDLRAAADELTRRSVTSQASEGAVVGWTNLHHLRRFLDGSAQNLIVIRNRAREWNLPLHLSASDLRFVPKELLPKVSS